MRIDANDIVRRAWLDLPSGDRVLLEAISADQWRFCERALGTYADELLRSAGRGLLPEVEITRANDALGLWVPELRVVLINESHSAFDGLDDPTLTYDLSRVAWHEWGHALSIDRAGEEDIAAGERYLALLPDGLAKFIRPESAEGQLASRTLGATSLPVGSRVLSRRRRCESATSPCGDG
jgi:hypothetical protein